MQPILIIATNPETITLCSRAISSHKYNDIFLVEWDSGRPYEQLRDCLANSQAEVIIAGGIIESVITKELPQTPIVCMEITPYDIIRCIKETQAKGARGKIAVITHEASLYGINQLAKLLNVELLPYPHDQCEDPQAIIDRALLDGAGAFIAGYSFLTNVDYHGYPVAYLHIDTPSILAAINEARRILAHILIMKRQREHITSVMNYTTNGIITIDKDSIVRVFNPAAQRILRIPESKALGFKINDVCPPLSMDETLSSGENGKNRLLEYRNTKIFYDILPINVDNTVEGAMCIMQDARSIQRMETQLRYKIAEKGLTASVTFNDILGKSQKITTAVKNAKAYAITDFSVLLMGESGTGKEMYAQSIHNFSRRRSSPFVAINCAAMPANLLESELFGYEAGAFTGATKNGKTGLFEMAHGGTLFLDEIGEMDLQLQTKLLRALQERQIMRVGGDHIIPIDIRLITATNLNLYEEVAKGRFRQDLFYRMNVLKLQLPPLRECASDIPVLFRAFFKQCAKKANVNPVLAIDAFSPLQKHTWPGNIRELYNFTERVIALYGNEKQINADMIENLLQEDILMAKMYNKVNEPVPYPASAPAAKKSSESDIDEIKRVLAITNNNYTKAAKILGIGRVTLWRKLKKQNLLKEND